MAIRKPSLVMIDVDGTLIDSVPDLAWCIDATMNELGLPERGMDRVRDWVGNGVERLVQRALVNHLDGEPEHALLQKALPIFMNLYADNNARRSIVYPGVMEGIDYMKSTGYRVGSVTNKAEAFTIPLLKTMGLYDHFEIVISGDTLPRKKPDPLPLLHAAEMLGEKPEDCLMLGDSKSDVKAARAANFQIVCVSYGYNHGEDIHKYSPDAVIDSFTELKDIL